MIWIFAAIVVAVIIIDERRALRIAYHTWVSEFFPAKHKSIMKTKMDGKYIHIHGYCSCGYGK